MKIFLNRIKITDGKDSKGEKSTIGDFFILNDEGAEIFRCYSVENGTPSSPVSGGDYRIMPETYNLEWNFTRTSTAKKGFRDVDFELWKDFVKEANHIRHTTYSFKNVGIQLVINGDYKFNNRWIFIHIANSGKDVEGCIGLGYTLTDCGVGNSTQAIQDFYDIISKSDISKITLEITDPKEDGD